MNSAASRMWRTGAPVFIGLSRVLERLLFAAAVLALAASAFVYHRHWMPVLFPAISHIQLQGQFVHIDRFEVEWLVRSNINGHFFDVNLHTLKRALEAMPWVRRVRVERVWPQTLLVELEEHDVAARWGVDALLSTEGVVFAPDRISAAGLVMLHASAGMELAVLEKYRRARELLAAVNGAAIRALGEDRHGSWRLILDNGIAVKLGDTHWESRLRRFVGAWRNGLYAQATRIQCIDARYPNGLAVVWKDRRGDCE